MAATVPPRMPQTRILVGASYLEAAADLLNNGQLQQTPPGMSPIQDLAPVHVNTCRILVPADFADAGAADSLKSSWDVALLGEDFMQFGTPPASWGVIGGQGVA